MEDNKPRYIVTLSDGNSFQMTEQEYKAREDVIFGKDKKAEVARINDYSIDDDIDDNAAYTVTAGGNTFLMSADEYKSRRDKIRGMQGAVVGSLSKIDYWGDKLKAINDEINTLKPQRESALAAYNDPANNWDITADADDIDVAAATEAAKRSMLAKSNLDDVDARLDKLYRDREANPAWQEQRNAKLKFFNDESAKIDGMFKELNAANEESAKISNSPLAGLNTRTGDAELARDMMSNSNYYRDKEALVAAKMFYEDAIKTESAPSRHDDSKTGFGNFFRGLVGEAPETLSAVALAKSLGESIPLAGAIKQIHDAVGQNANIVELVTKHPERLAAIGLSPAQREMLTAFVVKSATDWARSEDISLGYQAGSTAMQSLGFMADFFLVGGLGEAAAKGATKGITKAIAKASVEAGLKGVQREMVQAVPKFLEGTIQAGVKTLVMSPFMPSSYANLLDNIYKINDSGQVDLSGRAIRNAIGDVLIENLSESAGTQVEAILGAPFRVAGKAGIGNIFANTKFGAWGKALKNSPMAKIMKQAGWNGYIGEIGEEWYGNALRVMTTVDPDALKNFATVDQQIITHVSFAPMSVIGGVAMPGAQLLASKKQVAQSAKILSDVLAKNGYDEKTIQNFLDVTKAENPTELAAKLAPVINQAAKDNKDAPAVYKAVMDYADAIARYRTFDGISEADAEQQRQGILNEISAQTGFTPANEEESLTAPWIHQTEASIADGETIRMQSVRVLTDVDGKEMFVVGTPDAEGNVAVVDRVGGAHHFANVNDASLEDSGEMSLNDYLDRELVRKKQTSEQERMTAERQQANVQLIKQAQPGMQVNLGTVETPEMATILGVDAGNYIVQKSDGTTAPFTPQEMAEKLGINTTPKTDAQIEEEQAALEQKREDTRKFVNSRKGASFVTDTGENVTLIGVTKSQDSLQDPDGNVVEDYPYNVYVRNAEGKDIVLGMTQANMDNLLQQLNAQPVEAPVVETPVQDETPASPVEDNIPRDFRGNPLPMRTNKRTGQQVVDENALWNKDPEAWAVWNDNNPVQRVTSKERLEDQIKDLDKQIEKDTKSVHNAALKGIDADKMDDMEADLAQKIQRRELLSSILNKYNMPVAAGTDTFAGEQRKAAAEQTIQEQQAGFPGIQQKWNGAPKIVGAADEIRLANGETITGHYMLTDATAPTPSHDPANGFKMTEGFPVDENGKTVNDRDYEHDKEAQKQVLDKAANYDQRALQTPVIVSADGVVLSGNDRTMASQIAAANNTDTAYTEYLAKYPQKYGFTAEQVGQFQHPRVVFVPDGAMPYDAATFAKFNADDKKSQSKTEKAVKAGKTLTPESLGALATLVDRYDDINGLYNDANGVQELLNILLSAEVITPEQVAALRDGERLSGTGMDLLESTLIGSALDEEAVRVAMADASIRKSVVSAISQIIVNNTIEGYTLRTELTDAIMLIAQGKRAGEIKTGGSVQDFIRQQHLFIDDVVASATVQMIADAVNDRRTSQLKKVLSLYNRDAVDAANGQMSLLTQDVPSRDYILRNILEYLGYDTNIIFDTFEREAEQRAAAETAAQPGGNESQEVQAGAPVQSGEGSAVNSSFEIRKDNDGFIHAVRRGSTPRNEKKSLGELRESGLTNNDLARERWEEDTPGRWDETFGGGEKISVDTVHVRPDGSLSVTVNIDTEQLELSPETGGDAQKVLLAVAPELAAELGIGRQNNAQFNREEVAAILEQGNVGETGLAEYMTDDEIAEFMRIWDAFLPYNDALGEAYGRLDTQLKSSDKKVKKAAQAEIDRLEQAQNEAFAPLQEYVDSLLEKYDLSTEQSADVAPVVEDAVADEVAEEMEDEFDDEVEDETEDEDEEPDPDEPKPTKGKKGSRKSSKKAEAQPYVVKGGASEATIAKQTYTQEEYEQFIYGYSTFTTFVSSKTKEQVQIYMVDDSHPVYHDHRVIVSRRLPGPDGNMSKDGIYTGQHTETWTTTDYIIKYLKANKFKPTSKAGKKNKYGYWINQHGHCMNPIRIELPSVRKGWANFSEAHYYQDDSGKWFAAGSASYGTGGGTLGVKRGPYDTKSAAIRATIEALEYFRKNHPGNHTDLRDVDNLIRALKTKTLPQAMMEEGALNNVPRAEITASEFDNGVQGILFGEEGQTAAPAAAEEKPKRKRTSKKKAETPAASVEETPVEDSEEETEPQVVLENEEGTPGNFHWVSERVCTNPVIIAAPGLDKLGSVSKIALAEKDGKWYVASYVVEDSGKGTSWGTVIPSFKSNYIPYSSRYAAVKAGIDGIRWLLENQAPKYSNQFGNTWNNTKDLVDYLVKMELPATQKQDNRIETITEGLKAFDAAKGRAKFGKAFTNLMKSVGEMLGFADDEFNGKLKYAADKFRTEQVSDSVERAKAQYVRRVRAALKDETGNTSMFGYDNEAQEEKPQSDFIKDHIIVAGVPSAKKEDTPAYGSQNKLVTTDQYEELKKKMLAKLNSQLNAGFDPEILAWGAQMAMYHVEAGARKFIDFSQRMIRDLGEGIRPYLQAIYNGARYMPGMEELRNDMDSAADVEAINVDTITIEEPAAAEQTTVPAESTELPEVEQAGWETRPNTEIQGFDGLDSYSVYNACDEYIDRIISETGLNFAQVDMIAIGSRAFGTAREDSDLDILVEYEGDVKEDAVFNALNAEPLEIMGIKVDFFPIRAQESGTLTEWLESHDNGRPVAKEQPAEEEDTSLHEGDLVVLKNKPKGFEGVLKIVGVNSNGTYNLEYNPTGVLPLTRMGEPADNVLPVVQHHTETAYAEPAQEETPIERYARENFTKISDLTKSETNKAVGIYNALWNNNGEYEGETDGVRRYVADEYGVSQDYQNFLRTWGNHLVFISNGNLYQLDLDFAPAGGRSHLVARRYYVRDRQAEENTQELVRRGAPFMTEESQNTQSSETSGQQTVGELGKYTHTKTGKEMTIVRLTGDRLSSDEFKQLKARAKEFGGYYSSYGSAKGFLFDTEEDAIKFNNINTSTNVSENTDRKTASDTAVISSEAASVASKAQSIAESAEPADERTVNRTIQRIDDTLDKIDDQLALLGYYEADQTGPFHERYGYMKSAEKKAVKDADRLAKKLAADLGIEVGRKTLAKANIAPAGGDISFCLPLNEGRELYLTINIAPKLRDERIGGDYMDDLYVGDDIIGRNMAIMYRLENPNASGQARYEGSNNFAPYNVTYADLLRGVRMAVRSYLPEAPAETTTISGPVDVLQVAKEQAEKSRNFRKKSVSSQEDGDAMLGDLFDTLYEAEDNEPEVDETPAPAQRVKPTEVNGFAKGEKVIYIPDQGKRKGQEQEATIYDFEYDGRPVIDSGLAPILYEVVDWDQIRKIENETVNDTNYGQDNQGRPAGGSSDAGSDSDRQERDSEEAKGGLRQETGQEGGRTDTGRVGDGKRNPGSRLRLPRLEGQNTRNYRRAKGDEVPKTVAARYKANIAAIRLLKELQDSGKQATKEQMAVLRQYTGWGGLGGYFNNEYSPEYREMRSLLTDEEMQAAALSINTAYYTPTEIIDSMWDIAKRLGFEGGNVLEGSAGIGNILASMPKSISERSAITAVELDNITGGILQQLYPDANVQIKGFQEVDIPNGSVDLAITNVPFGDINVYDSKEKDLTRKFGGKIHDFCIAKNIRKLAEGGIGIFISTRGTLDGSSKALRQWIVNEGNADVIGAFRLNNATFEGTKATSDIIVVRKRVNGQVSPNAINVTDTEITRRVDYQTNETEWNKNTRSWEPITGKAAMEVNSYFVEHPENMGGEMGFGFEHNDTYRPGSSALWPTEKIDQNKRLAKWAKQFSSMQEEVAPTVSESESIAEDASATKEGQLITNSKGEICISRSGKAVPIAVNAQKVKGYSKVQVLADYDALKSAINEVLDYQLNNESDEGLKPLLDKLNKAYDRFAKRYDRLNRNTAISFLRNDVDFPSVAAVEDYKEKKSIDGKVKIEVKKTSIFSGRVLGAKRIPTPSNAKDGVIVSINQFGRIDIPFIAEALNKDEETVRKEILASGLGFENPMTGSVEVEYEYLSGNVREKLEYARAHNTEGQYDKNIEALEKVIPADIPAHLIEFSLGSDWMPVELYTEYAKEKFGVNDNFVPTMVGGSWILPENTWEMGVNTEKNRAAGVHSEKLRTDKKGHELMIAAMNNTSVVFSRSYKDPATGETITEHDKEATQAATTKMSEMRDDFKEWCKAKMLDTPELAERIAKIYNDTFNAIVPKEIRDTFIPEHFEGQVLTMGKENKPFHLYPHQARAVIRATTEPLMMAHEVGAGKTFTLIATAMEMRRLGTAKKPMIVVQNATLGQFVSSAKELYPNAKILTISESDRTVEGRAAFYAKIKYNDWDIIIVPQSVFEMMPDSEERQRAFIQEKIDEKKFILEQVKEAKNSTAERQLKKELEDLEYEYQYGEKPPKKGKGGKKDAKKEAEAVENAVAKAKKQLDRRTDDVSDFDDMGIDALLIDEAHSYKHLGFSTAMQRGVKGVDATGSKKSAGVYLKTRAVFDKVGWKNVVFATGTPISNTAAEIWTFMKYLMPADVMRQHHIYYFDDFVRNFGNISQSLEFTTSGKFKETTRFASYTNLPELIRIWSSVTDTVRAEDAATADGESVEDKQPKMEGGQARDIYLPQSLSLVDIMNAVRAKLEWYENLSGKEKKENSHIPLTMFGIAKMAAIDPRLVDKNAQDEPNSKTNKAVEETLRALKDSERYKGTAALFCDNFRRWDYNDSGKRVEGFNIFEEIKRKLVAAGVPEGQIVIMKSGMTTAAKEKIFARVNSGEVRVIMGTTATLGTGVNIQERLFFEAHLDAPNRPMDYTQRNGRILRQGNLHKEWGIPVRVVRFGVEDSLDVTAYQRLSTKAKFIDSIMDGKPLLANGMENRVLEEEDEGEFDNPVAVLSGSQYALLKSQAERELRKLRNKKEQHRQDQIYIERTLKENKNRIAYDEKLINEANANLAKVKSAFPDGAVKEVTIEGRKAKGAEQIAEAIKDKITTPLRSRLDSRRVERGFTNETLNYAMTFDGVPVNIKVDVERMNEYDDKRHEYRPVMRTRVEYSVPRFGIEGRFVQGGYTSIKDIVPDFMGKIATGRYFEDAVNNLTNTVNRLNSDNELMLQRRGKPFADEDKLTEQEKIVADYTEKMKAELAEKEAKYAEMAKNATTSFKLDDVSIEDEDEDSEGETHMNNAVEGAPRLDVNDPMVLAEAISAVNRLAKRLGLRVVFDDKLEDKGAYTEGTDYVRINLANCESVDDAVETLLHEGVAHFGLREMLGEDGMKEFIADILAKASPSIRAKIEAMAAENGWSLEYAAEEYVAELAQKTDYTRAERSFWREILQAVRDLISIITGRDTYITDDVIREMLVASYANLEERGEVLSPGVRAKRTNEPNFDYNSYLFDEYGIKANEIVPAYVMESPSIDAIKFVFGITDDEEAKKMQAALRIYFSKPTIKAVFVGGDFDKIVIFGNRNTNEIDLDTDMVHESIHAIDKASGWTIGEKVGKALVNATKAGEGRLQEIYRNLQRAYKEEAWPREMLSFAISDAIVAKNDIDEIIRIAGKENEADIRNIVNQIDYDRARNGERTGGQVSGSGMEGDGKAYARGQVRLSFPGRVYGRFAGGRSQNELGYEEGITHYRVRTKPAPKNTGIGYKVFYRGKDGKLYPPMVANPNGEATPVGVWLDADAAPVAGKTKTGRPQVKAGGKGTQGGSGGTLAYRPGWHLGEIPYAIQFNRINPATGQKELFPRDFVWAEVEYAADNNYQKDAEAEGINANGKFQHSLAGLKRVPEDGFYRYRTNPNPQTDPWIITGAMKVNRVLTNEEVDELVRAAGREPQMREGDVVRNRVAEGVEGFLSNAEEAVKGITQEKATPQQWLKMIESRGGLKAGEDKWIGLSEWLKSQDKKTITKQEVLDYIGENKIQIEEVHYMDAENIPMGDNDEWKQIVVQRYGRDVLDAFNFYQGDGGTAIEFADEDKAAEIYRRFQNDYGYNYKLVTPEDGQLYSRLDMYWMRQVAERIADYGDGQMRINYGKTINATRLDFTTDGLNNKREIALTVPTIESWNESDNIHFGDAGQGRAIAWARFGDAVIGMNGKALFIDEIQSKRHQEGREKGYSKRDLFVGARIGEYEKRTTESGRKVMSAPVLSSSGEIIGRITRTSDGWFYGELANGWETSSLPSEDKIIEQLNILSNRDGISAAPFEKNWHELAMKRMLRLAAEEGYDYMVWTTGEQQAERYNIGGVVKKIIKSDDYNIHERTFAIIMNDGNGSQYLTTDEEGNVVTTIVEDFRGKNLSEIFGKELAVRMLTMKEGETIEGEGLRVGGEGMKGFYDEILPRFMNKYAKKWGVQVEDKTLYDLGNGPLKVHAIRITPEMRESVMKGQLMFREGTESVPSPVSYSESMGARRLSASETARKCGIEIEFRPSSQMQFNGKPLAGRWINGKMYICLEHCRDAADAVRTVLHEGVGHNGLRRLIGNENMTSFCLDMFRRLPTDARTAIADAAITKYGGNIAEAVEEYLAERAEVMDFENEDYERGFWDIVLDGIRKVLAKIGIDIPLTQRDVRWLMWQSYNANKQTDVLNEAKRQVVANKLGFTLRQLSDEGQAVQIARNKIAEEVLAPAARIYNKDVVYWLNRLHETWVDKDNSVHSLVAALEKATGKDAAAFEDIRLALNQQSSKGLAAIEKWERENWVPMNDAIKALMKEKGCDLKDIERYVMIKHGLERNEVFAKRDAKAFYQDLRDTAVAAIDKALEKGTIDQTIHDMMVAKEDAKLDKHVKAVDAGTDVKYKELRKQDYGGLTAMYSEWDAYEPFQEGIESEEEYKARVLQARHPKYTYIDAKGREQVDMAATEDAAMKEVEEFEKGSEKAVEELWKRINNATKATLKHQYDANMLSRQQYLQVSGMFKYYVPLRGFAEDTAEDLYEYYRSDQRGDFEPPLLKAKGRKTEAESPFGYIGSMASSGIAADMKNETKLALYYFVSNRSANDLVTISEVWYEKTGTDENGKSIFSPVYPPLKEDLSGADAKQAYENWENEMKEKAKAGLAFKGTRKLNLHNSVIHIDKNQKDSHIIKFKVGGRDMMMYINGNPRAAQAINNELNVEMSTDYQKVFGKVLRWFSGINTSYNPEFWLSNAQRDALFALMSVDVKEDSEYGKAFRKNFGRLLRDTLTPGKKGGAYSLKRKLDKGELGDERLDKLYKEFVENGGVTGYTTLKNNEEWELELRKYTGQEKQAVAAVKNAFEAVQHFGEAIEQMTRFAAYITSREQGKEIKDAVNDAKELTVNFNRKGSGQAISFKEAAKLRTKNGHPLNPVQKAFVVGASWLPVYGRRFIMFFNASVQGLNAMYKLFKKDKGRMGTWAAAYLALGVIQAVIHGMLDDDDDYLDIPDYERRNNLLIGGKGVYFKWAMPQECRVFYGIGDMAVNHMMGRTPNKSIIREALESASDIAPLNPAGGLSALAPSAIVPIVEVALNRDYKGSKIYNDMRYLSDEEKKRTPKYTMAYQGTGKPYILLSQFANWLSGGDYADAGWLNINPASVEHILQGATGGAGTTIGKLYRGTVGQVLGEDFAVRNTPFLSRLLTVTDDRYRNAHTTELFDYYKAEAEHTKKLINTYIKNDDDKKLDKLYDSEDYEIMQIYESYKGMMKYYNEELKYTTDKKERKALMREQDALRKEMIQEISSIGSE